MYLGRARPGSPAQVKWQGHMSYPRLQFLSAVESVDEGAKGGVSELLSEASRLLPSSTFSNAASNSTRPAAIPQKTSTSFEN